MYSDFGLLSPSGSLNSLSLPPLDCIQKPDFPFNEPWSPLCCVRTSNLFPAVNRSFLADALPYHDTENFLLRGSAGQTGPLSALSTANPVAASAGTSLFFFSFMHLPPVFISCL